MKQTFAIAAIFSTVTMATMAKKRSMCVVTNSSLRNVAVMLASWALINVWEGKVRKGKKKNFWNSVGIARNLQIEHAAFAECEEIEVEIERSRERERERESLRERERESLREREGLRRREKQWQGRQGKTVKERKMKSREWERERERGGGRDTGKERKRRMGGGREKRKGGKRKGCGTGEAGEGRVSVRGWWGGGGGRVWSVSLSMVLLNFQVSDKIPVLHLSPINPGGHTQTCLFFVWLYVQSPVWQGGGRPHFEGFPVQKKN